MTDTVEARVARGAAWLDEARPGWERSIDLATLDLADSCRCVCGQVLGTFGAAYTLAGFRGAYCADRKEWRGFVRWASWHGFASLQAREWRLVDELRLLDEAWISLLKTRFDTGALSDAEVAP